MVYAKGARMTARQRVAKACLHCAAMTVLLGGVLATAPARSETSPFTAAIVDLFGAPGVPDTRAQSRSTDAPVAISDGTAPTQFGEASAAFGTGSVGFQGRGVGVGSAWSDGFTLTGSGSGQLAVSANVQAAIAGSNSDLSYELWLSSSLFDIDVVIAAYDSDGPIPNAQQRIDYNTGASANTVVFGTVPFTYGVPFYLLSVLSGDIDYAAGPVNVSASTAFGIGPSGLVGLSGTSYVAAVPEPTTWVLLAAGLAFIAFVAKNRARAKT